MPYEKSVEEVARMKGHVELANRVERKIHGEMWDYGKQIVRSVKDITIMTIRDQLANTNGTMIFALQQFPIPKTLMAELESMD